MTDARKTSIESSDSKHSNSSVFLSLLTKMIAGETVAILDTKKDPDGNTLFHYLVQELGFMFPPLRDFLLSQGANIEETNRDGKHCFVYLMPNTEDPRKDSAEKLLKAAIELSQQRVADCSSLEEVLDLYHIQHWCEVFLFILNNPDSRNEANESFFTILAKEAPDEVEDIVWPEIVNDVNKLLLKKGEMNSVSPNILQALDFWIQKCEKNGVCNFSLFLKWYDKKFVENVHVFRVLLRIFIKNKTNMYCYDEEAGLLKFIIFLLDSSQEDNCGHLTNCLDIFLEETNFDFNKIIDGKLVLHRLNLNENHLYSRRLVECAIHQASLDPNTPLIREILNLDEDFLKGYAREIINKIPEVAGEVWCRFIFPLKGDIVQMKRFGSLFSLDGRIPRDRKRQDTEYIWFTGSFQFLPQAIFIRALHSFMRNIQAEMTPQDLIKFQEINLIFLNTIRSFFPERHINSLLHDSQKKIALFETGVPGHSIVILIIEGQFLYRCNKGAYSFGDDVIEKYQIGNPSGITKELITRLSTVAYLPQSKYFIQKELHTLLDLKLIKTIPGKMQTVGNCHFESFKKAYQAVVDYYFPDTNSSVELKSDANSGEQQDKKQTSAKELFKHLIRFFVQQPALQDIIAQYQNTPMLNYALCRLLCTQFDLSKEKDREWGELAVSELKKSLDFEYHKVEFLIAHWQFNQVKQNQLQQFLHHFGVDFLEEQSNDSMIVKMFRAIINKNYSVIEEIIHSGIHPESLTYLGWTPLHIAVRNDDIELIKCFLAFAPHWVNVTNFLDKTPIFYAKSVTAAELLLQNRADFSYCAEREENNTAIIAAIQSKNFELVKYFLNQGVKLPFNAMGYAARSGCVKCGELVFAADSKSIEGLGGEARTPLISAAWLNKFDFAQFLINHGANLNAQDLNGNTALHHAAQYGSEEVLKLLLNQGSAIQLDIKNNQGKIFTDYLKPKHRQFLNDFNFFQRPKGPQSVMVDVTPAISCP